MSAGKARRGASWSLSVFCLGALRRRREVVLALALAMAAPAAAQAQDEPPPGVEDAAARTEHSQTFEATDGLQVTRLYEEPVNYLDGVGRWQPIDNDLEREGSVLRNGANSYTATLPTDLGRGAVTVQKDDQWVSFAPRGDD